MIIFASFTWNGPQPGIAALRERCARPDTGYSLGWWLDGRALGGLSQHIIPSCATNPDTAFKVDNFPLDNEGPCA
jgi:hypothetical protein